MNYVSTKTVQSKTQGGARFVIRKMNERRRQALTDAQAEASAKLRPLFEEFGPLNKEYDAAYKSARAVGAAARKEAIAGGMTEAEALVKYPVGAVEFADEKFARWCELKAAIGKIGAFEMEPVAMRHVVVRIDDWEMDGAPAGVEELLADGPDEFREEILREVKRELGLLPEETENLSSPSTSAGAVDGEKTTGGAAPAGKTATTIRGDAASSTGPGSATVPSTDYPR